MPLAIELAAARIKLLPPERSWPGSSTSWTLLTAGARDLPERQQTLRGAIAWSYDLLDDGARRLLDRLSVLPRRVRPRDGGGRLRPGDGARRRRHRRDRRARGPEPRPGRGGPTASRGSRCSRRSASSPPRGSRPAARRRRSGRATRDAYVALAEPAAPRAVRRRPAALAGATRAGARQPAGRPRLGDAPNRDRPVAAGLAFLLWRFWQKRGYLDEARRRLDAMAAKPAGRRTSRSLRRQFARGARRDRLLAGRLSRRPSRWYEEALELWREPSATRREIANALYNRVVLGPHRDHERATSTRMSWPTAGRCSRRRSSSTAELGDTAGEGNILWGLGSYYYFIGRRGRGRAVVHRGPRAPPGVRRADDGGLVAAHARPVRDRPARLRRGARESGATPCATSTRLATSPG